MVGFEINLNNYHKVINFKNNKVQQNYFETIFNDNLKLRNNYTEFSYFGAFRCGKSFSQQLAIFLICALYKNVKAIIIRATYDELKDTVIKQFNDEYKESGIYIYYESAREARFKNGSIIKFRTFEKDTGILSAEYDLAGFCQVEELPHSLFLQVLGRLSGTVLAKKGLVFVEGNPASNWVKERYKNKNTEQLKAAGIYYCEGQTSDNSFVTKEYIQTLKDNYPQFWLRRYLYGQWDNLEELVYSEFDEKNCIIDPIDPQKLNKDFIFRNGLDFGWKNPTACIWSYLDFEGNVIVYDEFYKSEIMPDEIARECLRHGKILTVADYSMKNNHYPSKDNENTTIWDELEANGMSLAECNKQELSNIVLVNSLLKQKKLKITKNCVNLIREIKNWKWKKLKLNDNKDLYEETENKDNHGCDALNYLVENIFNKKAVNKAYIEQQKNSLMRQIVEQEINVSYFS